MGYNTLPAQNINARAYMDNEHTSTITNKHCLALFVLSQSHTLHTLPSRIVVTHSAQTLYRLVYQESPGRFELSAAVVTYFWPTLTRRWLPCSSPHAFASNSKQQALVLTISLALRSSSLGRGLCPLDPIQGVVIARWRHHH